MADVYPEGTIVSSGLSKWASAGGWRLGYSRVLICELNGFQKGRNALVLNIFCINYTRKN